MDPQPRRVLLVDHAEGAQSVPGVEEAEIVEILDHHHIGSIETRVPVAATFDPVGSTATLVVERFRQAGMEPTPPTATMLLGAVLSDTVILNSPTTTERDHTVVEYLERVLALDATEFGREMFESTSDVSHVAAEEIVERDAKQYEVGVGQTISIAQVETVGDSVLDRKDELLEALGELREREGHSDQRADGHRHPGPGHRPARGRGHGPARARLRHSGRRRGARAARRDEPQEAGGAEADGGGGALSH